MDLRKRDSTGAWPWAQRHMGAHPARGGDKEVDHDSGGHMVVRERDHVVSGTCDGTRSPPSKGQREERQP
jgi:hypothetical protein